ncbi:hypothetical protein IQ268_14285 [Oculatella sp. LEGE 06141]|uniref:hypothetical protein n=1 Tax=Oculatella sp. LEGE 06141 TaxID=1828648 RepID=UPI0018808A0D|nr:hypothetical protein [Oculatella sp. LEGE 06141]MBE9179734.1 hypothetical protein [Oculatella sp. LEGE 06141]
MTKPIDEQDYSAESDSFNLYYSKFLGSRSEPASLTSLNSSPTAAIAGEVPSPKVYLNRPSLLARNSLVGAGSLVATLAVGFVLTDGASSQLPSQAANPVAQPQPDIKVADNNSATRTAELLPVPTSPEPIVVPKSTAARRPMREVLAERLSKLQAADETRLNQEQAQMQRTAIADRNQEFNRRLQLRAQAQQQQALAAANAASQATVASTAAPQAGGAPSAILSATSSHSAPASATSPQPQQGTSTPILSAMAGSESAAASSAIAPHSEAGHTSQAHRLELDSSVAIEGYDLSVFNPTMLEFTNEQNPAVAVASPQPAEPQAAPASSGSEEAVAPASNPHAVRTLQGRGIQDYLELPQRLSEDDRSTLPAILPLSQRAAAEAGTVDYLNQFLVFHLSPAEYQKLWGAKRFNTVSKTMPTYGVIDYQRRVVIVPSASTATVAHDATAPAANVQ